MASKHLAPTLPRLLAQKAAQLHWHAEQPVGWLAGGIFEHQHAATAFARISASGRTAQALPNSSFNTYS